MYCNGLMGQDTGKARFLSSTVWWFCNPIRYSATDNSSSMLKFVFFFNLANYLVLFTFVITLYYFVAHTSGQGEGKNLSSFNVSHLFFAIGRPEIIVIP